MNGLAILVAALLMAFLMATASQATPASPVACATATAVAVGNVAVDSANSATACASATAVVVANNACGAIPKISALSTACLSRKDFSGLLVKIIVSLTSLQTCTIVADVKVLVVNLTVYLNALIVQVLIAVDLIVAAVAKDLITVDLHASINKCHGAIKVVLGFAGCSTVSSSVLISALVDVGKVVKELVCDVQTVVTYLAVKVSALLTEVICALVVILHSVVFAVHLILVQVYVFLKVEVTAVLNLLTGALGDATTNCHGLVVQVTTCVTTNVDPVRFILSGLAALIVVLIAGVKGLLNSLLSLVAGLFASDC